ncbi:MAG: tetratricopeptide repeat protein [Chitinophagales bacterium]
MDNINTYAQIEIYLDGELKGEELQKFERKMQTDPNFAAQVEEHRDLETMMTSLEIDHWKQRAKTLLKEKKAQSTPITQPIKKTKPQNKLPYYLLRAAAVVLLVIGLAYFFLPSQSVNSEQLAMTYFEQTESSIYSGIERGEETDNSDVQLLNTAHEQYQEKSYLQAAKTLTKIAQNSPLYSESTLLSGLCYMQANQLSQAIQSFQTVANHPNTLSQEEANWLLALAHLKKGDIEAGKKQLQSIEAEKGGFSKQAASLLSEL